MARFYGKVGYMTTKETKPGVWTEVEEEHTYYGDVLDNRHRWVPTDKLNDDVTVSNRISIMADSFAWDHFSHIRYVCWMGVKWKVTSISVERPRLVLELGGEWNGPET
jgi:hypothetical protein